MLKTSILRHSDPSFFINSIMKEPETMPDTKTSRTIILAAAFALCVCAVMLSGTGCIFTDIENVGTTDTVYAVMLGMLDLVRLQRGY